MSRNQTPNPSALSTDVLLRQVQTICGAPALMPGEDPALYEELRKRLWQAFAPRDFIEAMWVQDWADQTWHEWRLRRSAGGVIHAAIPAAIFELLKPAIGNYDAERQSKAYAAGDKAARKHIEATLKKMGYAEEDIRAKAIELRLAQLQIIDRMQASVAGRRLAGVRELTRYRESVSEAPSVASLPAPIDEPAHRKGAA